MNCGVKIWLQSASVDFEVCSEKVSKPITQLHSLDAYFISKQVAQFNFTWELSIKKIYLISDFVAKNICMQIP